MTWTIGVDVGGTFTDFYAVNTKNADVRIGKRPSTPDNPAIAVVDGLAELAKRERIVLGQVTRLSHGTTVATNALIQRRGGKVALITTRGFRDLLEIGRQTRPHMYDFNRDFPEPLVPRELRFEVEERVMANGEVLVDLSQDAVTRVVAAVEASGAESCAVCLLFAFLNPAHEQRLARALKDALPDLHISLSSEVQPEFREYERFNTTVINAYLQPLMHAYMGDLESELGRSLPSAAIGINQSSGGLMVPGRARDVPVRTALSGPAAGAIGALAVGRSAGRSNIITLDVGGTSADVALIRDLKAEISYDQSVAEFPIRLPMVDIHTIGAGGGSVAWFDRDGLLKVGPASAGAVPGPACYRLGGTEPTVSDANLVLGRLAPELVGGAMTLDLDLAKAALAKVAERLSMALEETAQGIIGIAVANMVRAIRTVSVERGHDPRDFSLMPFGGAGPLHARDVAANLGIRELIVPFAPGILCAQGLVVSDLKEDFVASQRIRLEESMIEGLRSQVDRLLGEAERWFEAEQIANSQHWLELALDVRYVGQNYELSVPVAEAARLSASDLPGAEVLREMFLQVHEAAYGYANSEDPVEVINLRLTARGRHRGDDDAEMRGLGQAQGQVRGRRLVYFLDPEPLDTAVYLRRDLAVGQVIEGPAIVEQLDSTIPIYPGDRAAVDHSQNIIIELAS